MKVWLRPKNVSMYILSSHESYCIFLLATLQLATRQTQTVRKIMIAQLKLTCTQYCGL